MVTGLFMGLDRESTARYSFLLSVPGGRRGGAAQAGPARQGRHAGPHGDSPLLVGVVAAALSGLAAIWFVLSYLRTHTFTIFVVYRLVVASALLIVIATGFRHATGI